MSKNIAIGVLLVLAIVGLLWNPKTAPAPPKPDKRVIEFNELKARCRGFGGELFETDVMGDSVVGEALECRKDGQSLFVDYSFWYSEGIRERVEL